MENKRTHLDNMHRILNETMGKIPTDKGLKSPSEIVDTLMYGSYKANRGYGMTHEKLVGIGIGNDAMKERYESETN